MAKKFTTGDKVFAKLRGYAPWPAWVESVPAVNEKNGKYSVRFYGTFQMGLCRANDLFSYITHKEKLQKRLRSGRYQEAILQIAGLAPIPEKFSKVAHHASREDTASNSVLKEQPQAVQHCSTGSSVRIKLEPSEWNLNFQESFEDLSSDPLTDSTPVKAEADVKQEGPTKELSLAESLNSSSTSRDTRYMDVRVVLHRLSVVPNRKSNCKRNARASFLPDTMRGNSSAVSTRESSSQEDTDIVLETPSSRMLPRSLTSSSTSTFTRSRKHFEVTSEQCLSHITTFTSLTLSSFHQTLSSQQAGRIRATSSVKSSRSSPTPSLSVSSIGSSSSGYPESFDDLPSDPLTLDSTPEVECKREDIKQEIAHDSETIRRGSRKGSNISVAQSQKASSIAVPTRGNKCQGESVVEADSLSGSDMSNASTVSLRSQSRTTATGSTLEASPSLEPESASCFSTSRTCSPVFFSHIGNSTTSQPLGVKPHSHSSSISTSRTEGLNMEFFEDISSDSLVDDSKTESKIKEKNVVDKHSTKVCFFFKARNNSFAQSQREDKFSIALTRLGKQDGNSDTKDNDIPESTVSTAQPIAQKCLTSGATSMPSAERRPLAELPKRNTRKSFFPNPISLLNRHMPASRRSSSRMRTASLRSSTSSSGTQSSSATSAEAVDGPLSPDTTIKVKDEKKEQNHVASFQATMCDPPAKDPTVKMETRVKKETPKVTAVQQGISNSEAAPDGAVLPTQIEGMMPLKKCEEKSLSKHSVLCPTCGRMLSCPGSLKKHMEWHTGERPFKCSACPSAFRQKAHLTLHMRQHTGERPYGCDVCLMHFTRKETLVRHRLVVHEGERRFRCHLCPLMYSQKNDLMCHLRTHSGEKPFSCTVCDKRFSAKNLLRTHSLVHSKVRPYVCDICNASFVHRNSLKGHINRHLGIREFECDLCGKSFHESSHLNRHMRVHTKEKPFVCNNCTQAFASKWALRKHAERVHGVPWASSGP